MAWLSLRREKENQNDYRAAAGCPGRTGPRKKWQVQGTVQEHRAALNLLQFLSIWLWQSFCSLLPGTHYQHERRNKKAGDQYVDHQDNRVPGSAKKVAGRCVNRQQRQKPERHRKNTVDHRFQRSFCHVSNLTRCLRRAILPHLLPSAVLICRQAAEEPNSKGPCLTP